MWDAPPYGSNVAPGHDPLPPEGLAPARTVYLTAHDASRLPRSGGVVLLAERHSADPLHLWAAFSAIQEYRQDLRVFAGLGGGATPSVRSGVALGLEEALAWLAAGHALLCEVDASIARYACVSQLALQTGASVVALHLEAGSVADVGLHDAASALSGLCAAAPRIEARLASVTTAQSLRRLETEDRQLTYLRWRRHALAQRSSVHAAREQVASPAQAEVVAPINPLELAREVESLEPSERLLEAGDLVVCATSISRAPRAVAEIGRLRELTFREVGEGTGLATDLDRFDEGYLHLFVYNKKERCILGAYRLGLTDRILARRGPSGLYTTTLFDFGPGLLDALDPALELGRSFVRLEAQRSSKTLLLLWKGIARFVSQNPRYRRLFGPVSISARYQRFSRDLMVEVLTGAHRHPLAHLLTPKHPVGPRHLYDSGLGDPHAVLTLPEHLSSVVSDAESDGKGLPVLVSEYLKLGGRFLGFNVDPDFCGVTDGLVVVDLLDTDRRLLKFYMGQEQEAEFQRYYELEARERGLESICVC
jgi:putative hemolysin